MGQLHIKKKKKKKKKKKTDNKGWINHEAVHPTTYLHWGISIPAMTTGICMELVECQDPLGINNTYQIKWDNRYENTPIQINWKVYNQKKETF